MHGSCEVLEAANFLTIRAIESFFNVEMTAAIRDGGIGAASEQTCSRHLLLRAVTGPARIALDRR